MIKEIEAINIYRDQSIGSLGGKMCEANVCTESQQKYIFKYIKNPEMVIPTIPGCDGRSCFDF